MNAKGRLIAAVAAGCVAGTAAGQSTTTLYLIKAENLDPLSRAELSPGVPNPDNTYWIGHNPSCIAYGRGRMFVGGVSSGPAFPLDGADGDGDTNTVETTPFTVSIVKVNNILTTRSFSVVPGSRVSVPPGYGYTGLDYAPNAGATVRGLVATYDTGGGGTNLLSRYDVDTAGAGARVAPAVDQYVGFRAGSAGPAWDFGPAGTGVDYAPSGSLDGFPDGPVVAIMEFGSSGPYGASPLSLDASIGATFYEIGLNNGPRLAPDTELQTSWRDLCFDRRNGSLAARADNTLVFALRNANGTTTRVDLSPGNPATERYVTTAASLVAGQNVAIMSGFDDAGVGDLLAWNDRGSVAGGQPFTSVVKFNKTNRVPASGSGATVSPVYLNPDGSPAAFPAGNGLYDFFWDAGTQLLFVLDSAARTVYLFSADRPRSCCTPTGVCVVLNVAACVSAEVSGTAGVFGSGCSPSPCVQTAGACCTGAACTITVSGACSGAFKGAGTTCDFPGNPVTCCRANFNQQGGVSVEDIFDFLGAYFSGSLSADVNDGGTVTIQDVFDYLALYFGGCV